MKTHSSIFFICKEFHNDEYFDEYAEAALIEITPKLCEKVISLNKEVNKLYKKDGSINALFLFDYTPLYVTTSDLEEVAPGILDKLEAGASTLKISVALASKIKKHLKSASNGVKVDCSLLEIHPEHIKWNGFYKHTSVECDFEKIDMKELFDYAAKIKQK